MRPQERVWRKALRRPAKSRPAGRRPRPVRVQAPRRGSTWLRRHRYRPDRFEYWLRHAGTGRLIRDLKKQETPAAVTGEGPDTTNP